MHCVRLGVHAQLFGRAPFLEHLQVQNRHFAVHAQADEALDTH